MIGRRAHDDADSFDDAWNGRAPRDEHIAELVRCAEALCEAAVVEPSTDFRAALRTQLMDEAATVLVTAPRTPRPAVTAHAEPARPARRRLAGVTAALVASAGVVTMVASSASAVPGEMLYPVKRGMENVELALHRDDASRGKFQLARASERLAEASTLAAGDASEQHRVADLLDDFTATAADGWVAMDDAYQSDESGSTMQTVNTFAQSAALDLSALREALPDDAAPAFTDATDVVVKMTSGVAERCASCDAVDLGDLVSAVTDLSATIPKATKGGTSGSKGGTKQSPADPAQPSPATAGGGTTQTPKPVVVLPTSPTTKAPSLRDVTDPLVGGLLGDDQQEGLVPGLLNGLLGGGKTM